MIRCTILALLALVGVWVTPVSAGNSTQCDGSRIVSEDHEYHVTMDETDQVVRILDQGDHIISSIRLPAPAPGGIRREDGCVYVANGQRIGLGIPTLPVYLGRDSSQ